MSSSPTLAAAPVADIDALLADVEARKPAAIVGLRGVLAVLPEGRGWRWTDSPGSVHTLVSPRGERVIAGVRASREARETVATLLNAALVLFDALALSQCLGCRRLWVEGASTAREAQWCDACNWARVASIALGLVA